MDQMGAQLKSLALRDRKMHVAEEEVAKLQVTSEIAKHSKAEVDFIFEKEGRVRRLCRLVFMLKTAEEKLHDGSKLYGCSVLEWADMIDKIVGGTYHYRNHGLINFHCLLRKNLLVPAHDGSRNFVLHPDIKNCSVIALNYPLEQNVYSILLEACDYKMTFDDLMEALMKRPEYRKTCARLTQSAWNNAFKMIASAYSEVFHTDKASPTTPKKIVQPFLQLVGIDDRFVVYIK